MGLALTQPIFAVRTRTTGGLPGPVGNTIYSIETEIQLDNWLQLADIPETSNERCCCTIIKITTIQLILNNLFEIDYIIKSQLMRNFIWQRMAWYISYMSKQYKNKLYLYHEILVRNSINPIYSKFQNRYQEIL